MLESKSLKSSALNSSELLVSISSLELRSATFMSKESTVEEVMKSLRDGALGSILIGNDNNLEGVITERDFLFKISLEYDEVKNSPIEKFMTTNPYSLSSEDSIIDVISLMCNKEFRHIPVRFDGSFKIISVTDLISFFLGHFSEELERHGTKIKWSRDGVYLQEFVHYDDSEVQDDAINSRIFETPLRKIMFRDALHCSAKNTLRDAIISLRESKKGSALIMSFETELKGIISERDLLRKVYGQVDIDKEKVEDFMTEDPHKLLEQDLIAVAINNMSKYKYRSVIVANQGGYPISIVSILDILKYMSSKFKTE